MAPTWKRVTPQQGQQHRGRGHPTAGLDPCPLSGGCTSKRMLDLRCRARSAMLTPLKMMFSTQPRKFCR